MTSDADPSKENTPANLKDSMVVEDLWHEFYPRLKATIAARVRSIRRPVASESDIALSAFHAFVHGSRQGKYADLANRDEMWLLLKTIAIRKANDTIKHLKAKKRGGDRVIVGQSENEDPHRNEAQGIDAAASKLRDPHVDLDIADLFNTMMERLPDDRHRDVILLKLQGASVVIIAECLNTTTRTVQRLLAKIESDWRTLWLQ